MAKNLDVTILGLSITSSWGNGHATTYRHLVKALSERGHRVTFLERDVDWYAGQRDLPDPPWGCTHLYSSLAELQDSYAATVRAADLVIVGSYVPDGVAVGQWVTTIASGVAAFYDIDTPVTLGKLKRGDFEYITPELINAYDLYLSFAGGPTLRLLEDHYGSPRARVLYCSVDPDTYQPMDLPVRWDLGYLGTYSPDRQPTLETLLVEPAENWSKGRFVVAGPQYPQEIRWPQNVDRIDHLPPDKHAMFYNQQRFTLNVTRSDMVRAGHSPSVRLFEAAACGTPIVSDYWRGLESFFELGKDLVVASTTDEVESHLRETTEDDRRAMGERARTRVLAQHTAAHRAVELERYMDEFATVTG